MNPSSPIGRTQSGLAALFVMPSPKKMDGKADQAVDDERHKLSPQAQHKINTNYQKNL
jgi:hypothetical protein